MIFYTECGGGYGIHHELPTKLDMEAQSVATLRMLRGCPCTKVRAVLGRLSGATRFFYTASISFPRMGSH